MSRTMQFLARHSAGATSIVVFVAFAVAGTAIVGQVGPRHHGDDDCEWNEFGEGSLSGSHEHAHKYANAHAYSQ